MNEDRPGPALKTAAWWGRFEIPLHETRFWRIGPLSLWIQRLRQEWRLDYRRSQDPFENSLVVGEVPAEPPGDDAETLRVGFRETANQVRLEPACPDRPLLVRPASAFLLAPGEHVRLFMSIPLWIQIRSGRHPVPLLDAPCFPVSDSWFGATTMEGEICYASRTSARLDLDALPLRPQRAMVAVDIYNEAGSPLPLERIRLPVGHLSLFETEGKLLWTEVVRLHRSEDGGSARLSLGKRPPDAFSGKNLTQPREEARANLLTRTFGSLVRPELGRMDD